MSKPIAKTSASKKPASGKSVNGKSVNGKSANGAVTAAGVAVSAVATSVAPTKKRRARPGAADRANVIQFVDVHPVPGSAKMRYLALRSGNARVIFRSSYIQKQNAERMVAGLKEQFGESLTVVRHDTSPVEK